MKSPKRIAALLIAGFIAFAPPGTMIFLLVLAVGFAGRLWASAAALCVIAVTALLLLLRRRRRRSRLRDGGPEHSESN